MSVLERLSIAPRPCTSHDGRRCTEPECDTLLCYVNPGPRCFVCQVKEQRRARVEGQLDEQPRLEAAA